MAIEPDFFRRRLRARGGDAGVSLALLLPVSEMIDGAVLARAFLAMSDDDPSAVGVPVKKAVIDFGKESEGNPPL
jgi:hypothetical protein